MFHSPYAGLELVVATCLTCVQSVHKSDDLRVLFNDLGSGSFGERDYVLCQYGCLSMPGCLSFNVSEDVRLCELNNSSSTKHLQDFTVRLGFVYVHWITLPVSQ